MYRPHVALGIVLFQWKLYIFSLIAFSEKFMLYGNTVKNPLKSTKQSQAADDHQRAA